MTNTNNGGGSMKACVNSVTLFGPAEDIDKLKQSVSKDGEVISFEAFYPTPEELIELTKNDVISPKVVEKFGAINVNAWRLKNWGCLKDAHSSRIEDESEFDVGEVGAQLKNADVHPVIKEWVGSISKALSIVFTTEESPNNAIGQLSKNYPSILVHFGYDSESEGVCGWAALKGGEVITHRQYDDCLKEISVHVRPPMETLKVKLFDSIKDESN